MIAFSLIGSIMPPQASTIAEHYDLVYAAILVASVISSVILLAGMAWFVIKYKRKSANDKTAYITHNHFLEFLWSFIPLVIFLGAFVWGAILYYDMRKMPENALEIGVTGFQWRWDIEYRNGKKLTNEMVVPLGQPVKLLMTSADVIHSFYIPSFRVKQDVVPGMYSQLWFTASELGTYQVFCAEMCGMAHSSMIAKVKVVPPDEFKTWLASADTSMAGKSPVQIGETLYNLKGCVACHSVDGSVRVGPSFKGVFGKKEDCGKDGMVDVDENYLRESILTPNAKVVKGFNPTMPPFQGALTEDELKALIEFIKSKK